MTHVSTGQFTITDLHDLTYAQLSSESGLVPVDSAGTPKTSLSTSPLTTQMSVYKGNVLQTGWTFSRTQTSLTSSIDSGTGVLTVTAIAADSSYADITATKNGEPSITKRYVITKVYQGTQGIQGPTGPAGTPGYIGLSPSGNVLNLRGFNADGSFGASVGYIYVKGVRCTVGQATLTATYTGPGYILANTTTPTSTTVSFARLTVNSSGSDSWVEWKDYNANTLLSTNSAWFVIGTFNFSGSEFISAEIITPQEVSEYVTTHFMELLGKADIVTDTLKDWGKALGVERVFNRIAALEAFIDSVFANEITMSGSGRIKSSNYAEANGFPTAGYQFTSLDGIIKAVAAILLGATIKNAMITGQTTLECSDGETVFKTQFGSAGTGSYAAPSKTRWSGAAASSAVSAGATGSATVNGSSATYDQYFRSNAANAFKLIDTVAIATHSHTIKYAGSYHLMAQASVTFGSGSSYYTVKINGVTITASGTALGTYNYNEYRTLNVNDVVSFELTGNYLAVAKLLWEQDGVCLFKGSTGSITAFLFVANQSNAYSMAVTLGASFNSASNLTLASIDTWYNWLSDGETRTLTSSSAVTINGAPYTAKYITRLSNLLRIICTNGSQFEFSAPAGSSDPASAGWHNISGTLYPAGETRGVVTGSLIPVGTGKDVGEPGNRYGTGYYTVMDALSAVINSLSGTGTISGYSSVSATRINTANDAKGSGYSGLTNGMILEWGSMSLSQNATGSVTFPISFPNACLHVNLQGSADNTYYTNGIALKGLSASSFSYELEGVAQTVYWMAIGY
ncbi:MAG: hypothetical protein CVV52_10355 [Spirochaetae bacterium HGW-Spirochaetae-8]|jgi:hypothetical protein|nr:MAG: hypothetical protein CVV52_10355 [Spirochaetae bacterium HGW-Spirochaetae-8]